MPYRCRAAISRALLALLALACFAGAAASFPEGLVITSSQSLAADYNTRQICTSEPLRALNGKIYSDFKVSRTGASWEASTVILSQDAQDSMAEEVDTSQPIGLRLSLGFVGRKGKIWIHAVSIANTKIKTQGLLDKDAKYCKIPMPGCFEMEKCYTMDPPFGWGALKSAKKRAATVVDLNLTDVVDLNDMAVQVWAVPEGVSKLARWDTPIFTVLSWKFINFNSADEAAAMDEEEEEADDEAAGQDWSGGGSDDSYSGGLDGLDGGGDSSSDDEESEDEKGPTVTVPPPVTIVDQESRKSCPIWQQMTCVLDVLEKTCTRDEGSPRALISHKHPENVWICCCPWPYKVCNATERSGVCDKALQEFITPLGERPKTKDIRVALQEARGAMRTAEAARCASVTVAAKPHTDCGRRAEPPVARALARQELYCEMLTWQNEEMGDGTKDEFEANGCPWPANPGKPGDGKWRKGGSEQYKGQ